MKENSRIPETKEMLKTVKKERKRKKVARTKMEKNREEKEA